MEEPSLWPCPHPPCCGQPQPRQTTERGSALAPSLPSRSGCNIWAGRAGMAADVTGQCFFVGGRSSSSDELSTVKSITSTFFLLSDGLPSWTGLYWRPVGGKKTVSQRRSHTRLSSTGGQGVTHHPAHTLAGGKPQMPPSWVSLGTRIHLP